MKIAVASKTSDIDASVNKHGARAPFYLLFNEQGEALEAVSNPYVGIDRGAAPRVAGLLADKGVTLLAAGDFGTRFISELKARGIETARQSGQASDIARQLTA